MVSQEDLRFGQRIANYTFEYQAVGSRTWQLLVPPVIANKSHPSIGDRPDGHDPRDQYLGHKRIDFPVVNTSSTMSGGWPVVQVARVRFTCLRALAEPVYLRSITLRRKQVPWEPSTWDEEARRNAELAATGAYLAPPPLPLADSQY